MKVSQYTEQNIIIIVVVVVVIIIIFFFFDAFNFVFITKLELLLLTSYCEINIQCGNFVG